MLGIYEQIYIRDIFDYRTQLKVPSLPGSPIIDPHLSPDGSMIAYVRDCELHVVNMYHDGIKQLTHGAKENGLVSFSGWVNISCLRFTKCI